MENVWYQLVVNCNTIKESKGESVIKKFFKKNFVSKNFINF